MKKLVENKTAIVTGSSKGIGYAIARLFAEEGANVVLTARGKEALDKAVESITQEGGKAIGIVSDVTDENSFRSLVDTAVKHFGKLDILFNNAGSTGDSASITDISANGFDHTIQIDARSVLFGHKYAARQFQKQNSKGCIVTIASVAALQGGWSSVSYTSAKHAVVGIIQHAAKEFSSFGIRTNGIAPGVIMTPLIANAFGVPQEKAEELTGYIDERLGTKQALGRYGTVEDIANTALFLASDLSAYINGVVIPVDGGISSYTLSTSDEEISNVAKEFMKKQIN